MDIKECVIGLDALYNSMMKCKKGVIWKDSVSSFFLRAGERLSELNDDLENDTYIASPPVHFTITSPKKRDIVSITFRDRIFQRSLNDNIVYPEMTKGFILDNYACQTGKGTDAARERLKSFLRSYYQKYGTNGYVCQFDIKGYYQNMDHKLVDDMFKNHLDEWSYEKVSKILSEQYEGNIGYNPGSQLVQIAGVAFLNDLDHFIKEKLHIKYYIRYMDDFLLIHNDRDYLEYCKSRIELELFKLKFQTNSKKTRIFEISEGIEFLGFTFKLTETGKVLMLLNSDNVKREKRKLRRLVNRYYKGQISKSSVNDSYQAWRNHASKGNNFKLIQSMDKYYKDLWLRGDPKC